MERRLTLKKERENLLSNIKASLNHREIETIKQNICNIKNSIKRKTIQKQNCKHRRDNISNYNNIEKLNTDRRFYRNLLFQQHKIKNKRRKENYRNKINKVKAKGPKQNAVN